MNTATITYEYAGRRHSVQVVADDQGNVIKIDSAAVALRLARRFRGRPIRIDSLGPEFLLKVG